MIVRIIPGRLSIHRLNPPEELVSLPLSEPSELGLADFAPDGKYVVYGRRIRSSDPSPNPGIWLIEVATGHWRLLAEGQGTLPRWSPDGKFISFDRRRDKEILLLDVSQLDLGQGLQHALPLKVKFGEESVQKSAELEGQPVP